MGGARNPCAAVEGAGRVSRGGGLNLVTPDMGEVDYTAELVREQTAFEGTADLVRSRRATGADLLDMSISQKKGSTHCWVQTQSL